MSSSLPLPLPGPAATTGKKKKGGKKNVQGRTLTSAACNIPYGRSSVIFSGKSVAAAALSLSLPFSLSLSLSIGSKLDQTADFCTRREEWRDGILSMRRGEGRGWGKTTKVVKSARG